MTRSRSQAKNTTKCIRPNAVNASSFLWLKNVYMLSPVQIVGNATATLTTSGG